MAGWHIDEIEAINEEQARGLALESMAIKGYNVYLVDFGGYYGYSRLVFADGRHIYYANDYGLHHAGRSNEEMRKWYIDAANNILFTDDEIVEPLKSYDEYMRKCEYLHNYYGMRRDYLSIFHIGGQDKFDEQRKIYTLYDPAAYAYYKEADTDFVKHHIELFNKLNEAMAATDENYEYQAAAFLQEMYNHEYAYNLQADYDVLSEFGNIRYDDSENELGEYFKQLGFSELRRKAYLEARRKYLRDFYESEEKECAV